jgi:outer membrane protein insertion porin family
MRFCSIPAPRTLRLRVIALALAAACPLAAAPFGLFSKSSDTAQVHVTGYGPLNNLDLEKTLRLLVPGDKPPAYYTANFVEDAALILRAKATSDGYLNARVSASVTLRDGSEQTQEWAEDETPLLPRSFEVRDVRFRIEKGLLFHYSTLGFRGLNALHPAMAEAFFVETGGLLPQKTSRIYTPDRLKTSLKNLVEVLNRDGYENAGASVLQSFRNDRLGTVSVVIEVSEGRRSVVRSVRTQIEHDQKVVTREEPDVPPDTPYSSLWVQDLVQRLKQEQFRQGYPDTRVEVKQATRVEEDGRVQIDLLATVQTGARIKVGSVKFEGYQKSKPNVLQDRVPIRTGDWLDRIEVEASRHRLARLGVFDSVAVSTVEESPEVRDLLYTVKEGKRIDMSFLFGYGSYEMARAGFELEQFNVLGRAHRAKLRAVQSVKSSSANYTYTMPELFGKDTDVFINASGLSRKEISFTREEFGGGVGARRYVDLIKSDVSTRYNYDILNARNADFAIGSTARNAGVASLITDLRHDRRDNPLSPRHGYKLIGNLELASQYLGGDVDYQRVELNASYHRPVGSSRWIHVGASHGFLLTFGGEHADLPLNRRFFPGGENSMRGFQKGEAAPRDPQGRVIGAEAYAGANFEFEQGLTRQWSVVGFVDAVGFARDIGDYPFDETLLAVGAGLRWNTFIGPVRLEYGHNLNPRMHDPSGTVHLSIGFPF